MEIWKDIPEFERFYQSSDYGRLRSLDRLVKHSSGGLRKLKGRILKPRPNRDGHFQVYLYKLGRRSYLTVHRLVLQTFVGPCPGGMECCHFDGDPANNKLENLRWDTRRNNHLDAVRHGTISLVGERNAQAKLTDKKVRIILKELGKGKTQISLAILFGVSRGAIQKIANNKTWKHIPRE